MNIKIPELSLILLVGVSGSGKSSFAAKHFLPTEVLSSDFCRGLVSDDENNQAATQDAFDVLGYIAGKRLAAGRLTVVDATNVQPESRRVLVELAKRHHVLCVAIVLSVAPEICLTRNEARLDRDFGPQVIRRQLDQLRRSMRGLRKEGFHRVVTLDGVEEIESATFTRERVWNDRRDQHGPFDIIGDVHGCFDELSTLLGELGYEIADDNMTASHPEGRRALFLGDLVDRGPKTPAVLHLVMGMVHDGTALCVPGNHEVKLLRALQGRQVTKSHGLAESLEQLESEPKEFIKELVDFLDGLIGHFVLDDGQLVVAHAGLPASMHGRQSGAVRAFALYGDTSGETDEFGLPIRYPWAEEYRGEATVVYGHTPVPDAVWINKTICLDTGCVFGGSLTALRYPERELVSVPAQEVYYEPVRPLVPAAASEDSARDSGELDLTDVVGKRIITTTLTRSVTIREENAIAALEVMSRWAIDPRWLIYLPPTMAPTATTKVEGLLEHPGEAFEAYRSVGVERVVCEEKHMGSRAVVVVCRDQAAATRRFSSDRPSLGVIHTRTGRPFFAASADETAMLERVRDAVATAGLWDELGTDWLVLDCELLPWSAKAEDLLRGQYAAVGAAATSTLAAEQAVLRTAAARGIDVTGLATTTEERIEMVEGFVEAYRRYCWDVETLDDLKLAPFQILAGDGETYAMRDHAWHLEVLSRLVAADEKTFRLTRHVIVDLADQSSIERGVSWWQDLTAAGGEGMVVKPIDVVVQGAKGLVQPGIKCRSREYLRIIYGPEYTAPQNLERLRSRGLGLKRSLAIREFSLGIEALQRFVMKEPLYRVHECVFGVLALESEPVDPRL
jgi:protein phosphatase